MSLVVTRNRSILAAALLVPFAGSVSLIFAQSSMSPSTLAAATALVLGMASVALMSWRNGQATGSVGQLIHETETVPAMARINQEPAYAQRS